MADKPSEDARPEPTPEPGSDASSSVPDDVWEKFIQDSERDIRSSAPKEPSARARMVTERLRQQEARGELPPGWRTGPARRETDGRATRRRRLWALIGVPLAVAVAVVAVRPSLLPGDPFGTGGPEPAAASPLPAEEAAPTAPPSAASADLPTRKRPFAGSPAEQWASGEQAIELPKAKAVGGISAARIETALRRTKEFLVASNLDREVLYGAEPKRALALVDPLAKEYLSQLRDGLRRPTAGNDPKWTFTRFDRDEIELVGDDIRVRGRTTVDAGSGGTGRVTIKADYTFVYPVVRAAGGDEVARTIIRRVVEAEVPDPARYQVTEGRLWVVAVDSEIGNDLCREGDGFIHPLFDSELSAAPQPTGKERDPYDRSRELTGAGRECGTVTRT